MKILSVLTYYSPHWTGLTAYAARVAEGLVARGHKVTVLTTRYQASLARDEMLNGVRVVRIQPVGRFSRGMITPAYPWAAAQLIRQHDTVHIHTPLPEAPLVGVLCRILQKPMLMTHHGDVVMPPGAWNQALQRFGFWLTLAAGRLARRVTSHSQDYAEHSPLLQRLEDKLAYVYPPVEFPEPIPENAQAWRVELGLQDKKLIGISGRWVREKGFDVLLRALPLLREQVPDAHLVFAGERDVVYEDFYEQCQPLIEAERDHITFLGLLLDRQRMADFYAMCDLFALPSRTDMMPSTQIEALLCGTPVVASDIPGARVVVRETGCGVLAPPEDAAGLARAIESALDERKSLQPKRETVREVFDPEQSLDSYESLLRPDQVDSAKIDHAINRSSNGSRPWKSLSKQDLTALDRFLMNEADMAFRRRAPILMDYLELKDGDRVIDLGCGMGFHLMVMSRLRKLELHGLDQDPDRLVRAQAEVPDARVLEGDILALPFGPESFDKALLTEVLEHIRDDESALRAIYRLLKPGGVLAISVPHAQYPVLWDPINWSLTSVGGRPIREGPIVGIWTNHERLYLPSELSDRLTGAGFEVDTIEETTHYCFPFSHFLVYGIGKPLLERKLLPEGIVNSADRFRAERNSRSYLNPINLGVAAFRYVDRINDRAIAANKHTYVNVLVKARKPLAA